jgi:hypothetical protein
MQLATINRLVPPTHSRADYIPLVFRQSLLLLGRTRAPRARASKSCGERATASCNILECNQVSRLSGALENSIICWSRANAKLVMRDATHYIFGSVE